MTIVYSQERFAALVNEFQEQEDKILNWKAGEYTQGVDRIQNFRQVAQWMQQKPSEVALCYLMKHVQSITIAVYTGKFAWAWETPGGEGLKQRVADIRNYLLLLAACLDEEAAE
ncbi:MAG: hypothetical protein KGZ56_00930 [Dethiobacter sp.]|nr:hypothetical protein [Dethiobacter sp.]MBS3898696.1 hypothetical protein [Dethiobacter sp.]